MTSVLRRLQAARAEHIPATTIVAWLIGVTAIALIALGAWSSVVSGRLTSTQWINLVVFGLSQGSIYALVALGYTMVYGVLGFINFAHGEVFMTGIMAGYIAADALHQAGLWNGSPLLALAVALAVSVTTSTVVAVILERVAYRPLRASPRLIPLITSIGASYFLQYTFKGLFGASFLDYPTFEALKGTVTVAGLPIQRSDILVIGMALAMMAVLWVFVERTRAGKAMRAVAEDKDIAALMGVDVDRTIVTTFAVGGAMAGVAALLFGLSVGQAQFAIGFVPGIKAFTSAVLGGVGNVAGAMAGGLVLGIAESLGPSLVLTGLGIPAASQLKDVVAFTTLVLVLILRPTGLLGERLADERA